MTISVGVSGYHRLSDGDKKRLTLNQSIALAFVVLVGLGLWLADFSRATIYWACAAWVALWFADFIGNRKNR